MHNKGKGKLLPMSRIAPKRNELSEIDTVASAKRYGDRRAFDILMEAQYYWNQMEDFRKDRERNNQAKIIPNVMIDKDKVRCPTHIPTV